LTLGLKEIDPHQFDYVEDPTFAKREGELESPAAPRSDNPNCYVQTCEQFIIGRDLTYKEALKILQQEEYLSVAAVHQARRTKRYIVTNETIEMTAETKSRSKRSDILTFLGESRWLSVSKDVGNSTINFSPIQDVLLSLVPMVGLLFLGTTLVGNPVLPLVTKELVPPGNPLPGKPGGGGLPEESGFETLDLAIGLDRPVVATFPPFDTEHAYPAQAIIFSEIPNIKKFADNEISEILNIGRKKRSPLFSHPIFGRRRRGRGRSGKTVKFGRGRARAVPRKHRARSGPRRKTPRRPLKKSPRRPLQRRPKGLLKKPLRKPAPGRPHPRTQSRPRKRQPRRNPFHRARPRKQLRRKGPRRTFEEKGPSRLSKKIQCLRTNLYAHYHPDVIDSLRYITQVPYDQQGQSRTIEILNARNPAINSLDDCIDGILEPLYGFRVRVTIVEDEPCILGETCEKGEEMQSEHAHGRSSDKFFAEGYPSCHARYDPYLSNC